MTDSLTSSQNKIRTQILLAVCGLLAIAAAAVGIDDNPPGVLPAYLAALAFVRAFVHPWRTAGQFRRLVYASVLGAVLLIVLAGIVPSSFPPMMNQSASALIWLGRRTESRSARRAIRLRCSSKDIVGFTASLEIQLSGSLNALGWSPPVI